MPRFWLIAPGIVTTALGVLICSLALIDDPLGQSFFAPHDGSLGSLLADDDSERLAVQRAAGWLLRRCAWLVSWWRLPERDARVVLSPLLASGCALGDGGGDIVIRWDDHGVPHVLGDSPQAALVGQGFAMARDRLFQLEFLRRVARAETHTLFGDATLPLDRLLFDLQFERLAGEQLAINRRDGDAAFIEHMACYAAGVNGYLSSPQYRQPVELLLTRRHTVEPFDLVDLYAINIFSSWIMSRGGEHELARAVHLQHSPSDEVLHTDMIDSVADSLAHVHLPAGVELNDLLPLPSVATGLEPGGSNAWALAGWRTKSGKPLLANDPHLMGTTPNSWYLVHLRSRDGVLNVAGATFIGMPLIASGHNDRYAWGVTLSYVDSVDYYVEQVRGLPDSDTDSDAPAVVEYLFEGRWLPVDVHRKRASDGVLFTAYATHHGPLVTVRSGRRLFGEGRALAMASTIHTTPQQQQQRPHKLFFDELLLLSLGRDWADFSRAFVVAPVPISGVYADVDGNIGYRLGGFVPLRRSGAGPHVPFDGWTGEHEWTGFLPNDDKPFALNPAQGYVVSTNNRIVAPDRYAHFLSDVYAATGSARSQRAAQLLAEQRAADARLQLDVQLDVHSIPAATVQPLLCRLLERIEPASPAARRLRPLLEGWSGDMHRAATAPTVYHAVMHEFLRLLFDDAFGPHPVGAGLSTGDVLRGKHFLPGLRPTTEFAGRDHFLFHRFLSANASALVRDHGGVEQLLGRACDAALAWLVARLGTEPAGWAWGRLHSQTWVHPMGRTFPGSCIFNLGPLAVDGDETTLFSTGRHHLYAASGFIPSARLVWDCADWDNSFELSPPGQSANMASPQHANMAVSYQRSLAYRAHWSERAVAAATVGTWQLTFAAAS